METILGIAVRTFELVEHRRVRLWLGDQPNVCYTSSQSLTYEFLANGSDLPVYGSVAAEALVPMGGRFMYGLLGASFKPSKNPLIRITVGLPARSDMPFDDNLAARLDEVRVGLTSEYADAVRDTLYSEEQIIASMPGGDLLIECAAQGKIGSSADMFRRLTSVVLRLVQGSDEQFTDSALVQMLNEQLTRPRSARLVLPQPSSFRVH
jgi:hypothetical protein